MQNTKATPRRPSLRFDACGLDEPGESDDLRATEHRQLRKGCKTVGHVLVLKGFETPRAAQHHTTISAPSFCVPEAENFRPREGDK